MRLKLAVIFLLLSSVSTYAQEWVTMSGVVTDKRNTPMVGVIILENGVQTGVMTNAKGKYSITTTPGATIEFKFLGYKTEKKKAVEGEENIKMKDDGGDRTKVAIGVTGGGIATQLTTDYFSPTPYLNGYGGAFISTNMTKWLGLKAGANYMLQGGHYMIGKGKVTLNQTNINIPVNVVITPFKFLSLEAGAYQNILLDSSCIDYGNSGNETEISPDEGALKYNVGAFVGASLNFGRTFFINARYYKGQSWYYAMNGTGYMADALTVGIGLNLIKVK